MSKGLAQSGIEKWTVDTGTMTMTFYDKTGREMLVEQIKQGVGSRCSDGSSARLVRTGNQKG